MAGYWPSFLSLPFSPKQALNKILTDTAQPQWYCGGLGA